LAGLMLLSVLHGPPLCMLPMTKQCRTTLYTWGLDTTPWKLYRPHLLQKLLQCWVRDGQIGDHGIHTLEQGEARGLYRTVFGVLLLVLLATALHHTQICRGPSHKGDHTAVAALGEVHQTRVFKVVHQELGSTFAAEALLLPECLPAWSCTPRSSLVQGAESTCRSSIGDQEFTVALGPGDYWDLLPEGIATRAYMAPFSSMACPPPTGSLLHGS
jgi:hypothetical protein